MKGWGYMSVKVWVDKKFDALEIIEGGVWSMITFWVIRTGQLLYKGVEAFTDHSDDIIWHPLFWMLVLVVVAVSVAAGTIALLGAFVLLAPILLILEILRGWFEDADT